VTAKEVTIFFGHSLRWRLDFISHLALFPTLLYFELMASSTLEPAAGTQKEHTSKKKEKKKKRKEPASVNIEFTITNGATTQTGTHDQ